MQCVGASPALKRRGSFLPALVIALVVILAVIALVLNRLWIDSARMELRSATDASVLAACSCLVDDDLLRARPQPRARVAEARRTAAAVAGMNLIAGEPLRLHPNGADVRLGKVVIRSDGESVFLETDHGPTTVFVQGHRRQDRLNPLGLMLSGISGQPMADLFVESGASIDNQVVGLRASPAFNVPALPLAILLCDPSGRQKITWQTQIDLRAGPDRYGFDAVKDVVTRRGDGIPEIELVGVDPNVPPNACLIHVGGTARGNLVRQIDNGWSPADLESRKGELSFTGKPLVLKASPFLGGDVCATFQKVKGQPRIVLLYASPASEATALTAVPCVGFAAGRVMEVRGGTGASPRIVFQPAVVSTRAAVLACECQTVKPVPNPYVYKVKLIE